MIPVNELCECRNIRTYDLPTPILIPSFSSKGFPEIAGVWGSIDRFLPDAVLVSSYDLFYGHLGPEINTPTLLFVDSGGYEARGDFELSEIYNVDYRPNEWDREKHRSGLNKLKSYSAQVLISFDEVVNQANIITQIGEANNFFSEYPDVAKDFLVKPNATRFLDINELESNAHLLEGFDIVGVTEKELGASLVDRLQNVTRLRIALSNMGLATPIHIFGCIDPISTWLFYLCGADIFDGLSWLRFVFHNNLSIYRNTWAVMTNQSNLPNNDLTVVSWVHNLQIISKQQTMMANYASKYDFSKIPMQSVFIKQLNSAGISLG